MTLLNWFKKPLTSLWAPAMAAALPSLDELKSGPGPYAVGTSGLKIWQLDQDIGTSINLNHRDTGLVALMKPSTFLRLTTASSETFLRDPEKFQFYIDKIKASIPFPSPYLCISVKDKGVIVQTQEGCHRMAAIMTTAGDDPVPVILHPAGSSFSGPEDLAHILSTKPIIGRSGEALPQDVPFISGTLERLKYCGRGPSRTAHLDSSSEFTVK